MKRLINPEMDALVGDLNELVGGSEAGPERAPDPAATSAPLLAAPLDPPGLEAVARHEPLVDLLAELVRRQGSDLLLVPGAPPVVRVAGRLEAVAGEVVDAEAVVAMMAPHLGARARANLEQNGAADLSLRLDGEVLGRHRGIRLRVNLQRQRGRVAAALRLLPQRVPRLEELGLPGGLGDLVAAPRGLVLVCGPTGSGKSTTLAALVDEVNRGGLRHVITIEDPVEYEHDNHRAVIEQLEIGRDTPDFAVALRSCLRRDPDVLLVGEMRDPETVATAVTAAETGHLILSTLHTAETTQAVHRVVDAFAAEHQAQIRQQLALSLHGIVCQQLIPRADGEGRVPAVEVLRATHAVRNHIRKGTTERIYNELLTGRRAGMCTMEDSLAALVARGVVDADEARARAPRLDELDRRLATG